MGLELGKTLCASLPGHAFALDVSVIQPATSRSISCMLVLCQIRRISTWDSVAGHIESMRNDAGTRLCSKPSRHLQ